MQDGRVVVIGRRCFTARERTSDAIRNEAWKNSVFSLKASCSITVVGWCRDSFFADPGVSADFDLVIQVFGVAHRVAVGPCVMTYGGWVVFRCFVYPQLGVFTLGRRVGFLRVPRELVASYHGMAGTIDGEVGSIPEYLQVEWACISEEMTRYGIAVFPQAYSYSVQEAISVTAPAMFRDESLH